MRISVFGKRLFSLVLTLSVCAGATVPAAAKNTYDDFDEITSHVNLKAPSKLTLTRPSDDVTTTASAYFITGGSNPGLDLTMNGEPVAPRGVRGSFGVFVGLEMGENTFVFKQGGSRASVTITRAGSAPAVTITNVRSMAPEFDCANRGGETINLSCVAPSGGSVTATVGGRTIRLTQAAAASKGVPASFTGRMTAGDVSGTKNLGPVVYTLTYGGKTSQYKSAGSVFLAGSGGELIVQFKNTATSLYKDEAWSAFIESPKEGAVDSVAEIGSKSYRLSTGGWVSKESVQPLTEKVPLKNTVSDLAFNQTNGGEEFILYGTANVMFRAWQDSEKLHVRLFNTSGAAGGAGGWTADSSLFSGVGVTEEDEDTILEFELSGDRTLWGYDIGYDGGDITIYAKYAPRLSSGGKPLKGVTVMLDAGHGGYDPGAIGIPGATGAMEKDITLATAIAVQKRLQSLGATAILCRDGDDDMTMNARMQLTRARDADFFISLHCNSVGYAQDANKPSGTEVYYFEGIAKQLASTLSANVSGYTGRTNRGAKHSNYRVTLNSFAPSVLVEMGFLTNPAEYDSMASRRGIFNTANAVGDGLIALLS